MLAKVSPLLHQPSALIEDVAALVGALKSITLDVRQAELDDFAGSWSARSPKS
jgi:hypothetical protein